MIPNDFGPPMLTGEIPVSIDDVNVDKHLRQAVHEAAKPTSEQVYLWSLRKEPFAKYHCPPDDIILYVRQRE